MIRQGEITILLLIAGLTGPAYGQARNGSSFQAQPSSTGMMNSNASQYTNSQHVPNGANLQRQRGRRMQDYSRIFIAEVRPREIKVHDIITIVVNEKSEVTLNSRFIRQRQASLKAELKEFLRIGENGNLNTAATDNQPSIDATLSGRMQTNGSVTDSEGIRYRIAAMVVDIRPNGNLVLEAKKTFQQNEDLWEYSLTGILRVDDIQANNTALSENIATLDIKKHQRGKVFDSTKRPWGIRLYDWFSPF